MERRHRRQGTLVAFVCALTAAQNSIISDASWNGRDDHQSTSTSHSTLHTDAHFFRRTAESNSELVLQPLSIEATSVRLQNATSMEVEGWVWRTAGAKPVWLPAILQLWSSCSALLDSEVRLTIREIFGKCMTSSPTNMPSCLDSAIDAAPMAARLLRQRITSEVAASGPAAHGGLASCAAPESWTLFLRVRSP